jgi:4-hydroxythreonine-4-phosphate dehydrogenase
MSIRTAIRERRAPAPRRVDRPIIALSMGDAGGIGPEVALKAVSRPAVKKACRVVVVGDMAHLTSLARDLRIPVRLRRLTNLGRIYGDAVHVHEIAPLPGRTIIGRPSVAAGRVAGRAVEEAVKLARSGIVKGIVTAPVSKESFALAGYGMVGHTEILARLTGTRDYAMMLASGDLRVVFATTHLPHRKVASRLTRSGLAAKIRLTEKYLSLYMGIRQGRIAVACLNPHCGESGGLGREEQTVIRPAIAAAQDAGIRVEGPFAADSIYRPVLADRYDAIIAMYHDQGMIPLKLRGHGDVVNITLGIPVVRTSPGHGTAFDKAGRGTASARSMTRAILECVQIIKRLDHAG